MYILACVLTAVCLLFVIYSTYEKSSEGFPSGKTIVWSVIAVCVIGAIWIAYFYGAMVCISYLIFLVGLYIGLNFFAASNGEPLALALGVVFALLAIALQWAIHWFVCSQLALCGGA